MTNHFDQQACETYGPLISGKIDGEISGEASLQLDQHLAVCSECQQRLQKFRKIDELIFSAATPADADTAIAWPPVKKQLRENKQTLQKELMRWIPLAVAASVLIGLIVIALPSKSTVTAEQIAIPLAELEMITDAQHDNQVRMLKSFELELRALKLQLMQNTSDADSADTSVDKQRVSEEIDRLIEKVNQYGETDIYQ